MTFYVFDLLHFSRKTIIANQQPIKASCPVDETDYRSTRSVLTNRTVRAIPAALFVHTQKFDTAHCLA